MTPYEILGIGPSADDATIRNAYLELVKKHPPDRAPEMFKKIANAYGLIRDERERLHYYVFNRDMPINRPFEALLLHAGVTNKRKPPSFERLKELLSDV
ncbi:MAG: J domain-containing protein [Candidatus Kuenenia sp.]|nr:J domain-containing protein [Candidatus Kuenenia sp.]